MTQLMLHATVVKLKQIAIYVKKNTICEKVTVHLSVPKTLIFSVYRHHHGDPSSKPFKLSNLMNINMAIGTKQTRQQYSLKSVTVRSGTDKDAGHYVAAVQSTKDSWVTFNDAKVTTNQSWQDISSECENHCRLLVYERTLTEQPSTTNSVTTAE